MSLETHINFKMIMNVDTVHIHLLTDYLMMLSTAHIIYVIRLRLLVNNVFKRLRKEAIMANFTYYPSSCLEIMRNQRF
jgi:hypothetical protein